MVRTSIRERVVDHLAHIDTKLAEAVGANLGIELSDDQRNITLPAPVNGVEKDPSLSLYADAEGDVKGRVVAVLLNERTSAQDLVQLLQALQAQWRAQQAALLANGRSHCRRWFSAADRRHLRRFPVADGGCGGGARRRPQRPESER